MANESNLPRFAPSDATFCESLPISFEKAIDKLSKVGAHPPLDIIAAVSIFKTHGALLAQKINAYLLTQPIDLGIPTLEAPHIKKTIEHLGGTEPTPEELEFQQQLERAGDLLHQTFPKRGIFVLIFDAGHAHTPDGSWVNVRTNCLKVALHEFVRAEMESPRQDDAELPPEAGDEREEKKPWESPDEGESDATGA